MSQFNTRGEYPTPEEIMATEVTFKRSTIDIVNAWKDTNFKGWKQKTTQERTESLKRLASDLLQAYSISASVDAEEGAPYQFDPYENRIMLDSSHPSIISTLHEVCHAIYGPSEKQACRWSVWLFKKTFPKSFDKLQFAPNSHLLVQKT